MMRKRITDKPADLTEAAADQDWLDLTVLARVEYSSEDPAYPVDNALQSNLGTDGWRAMEAGAQTLRLLFEVPVQVRRIHLVFRELEHARTQEFVLRCRCVPDRRPREIVRQQHIFSPPDNNEEQEDYAVRFDGMVELELCIVPEITGGSLRASLSQIRLA
jgi:hypothetical protein